jgi:hypothetical protein
VIALICWQALTKGAYANWAVAAYFAGTVVAVGVLMGRPVLLGVSLVVNGAIALALPILTTVPQTTLGRDRPVLERYLGRESLSREILAAAGAAGNVPIVADDRDVLADLFYTGRDAGITIYAQRPVGRPENHYEQAYAMPAGLGGQVLFVSDTQPLCHGAYVTATLAPDLRRGTFAKPKLRGYLVDAECLDANP